LTFRRTLITGGIGLGDVFALPEMTCGRRVGRVEPNTVVGDGLTEVLGEFWGNPRTRTFAELLIDCEEDRTFRAVLVGMLPQPDR
jgi:hypothetical protein